MIIFHFVMEHSFDTLFVLSFNAWVSSLSMRYPNSLQASKTTVLFVNKKGWENFNSISHNCSSSQAQRDEFGETIWSTVMFYDGVYFKWSLVGIVLGISASFHFGKLKKVKLWSRYLLSRVLTYWFECRKVCVHRGNAPRLAFSES